jgi:Xaa-Pro aminopeptidase
MVVTDEPIIYLLGFGRIKIEDIVHVGRGGAEKLILEAYYLGK